MTYYYIYICIYINIYVVVLVTQSCPTLYSLIGCSPPGSSVQGFLYARILEWVAIPFFRGVLATQESKPGLLPALWTGSLPSELSSNDYHNQVN